MAKSPKKHAAPHKKEPKDYADPQLHETEKLVEDVSTAGGEACEALAGKMVEIADSHGREGDGMLVATITPQGTHTIISILEDAGFKVVKA